MNDFHIRGRIETKSASSYYAVVVAIPSGDDKPFEKMQVTCKTRESAVAALRELTVAMGRKLRAEGGTVLDVRTDE